MDPERLAKIPVRMKEFVDRGTIAGAVTLVARHGAIASLEAVGYTDLDHKKPMRTDAIFQIHSMTKPVTATGVMLLMEEGKLALSDPVEKYLPEFRGMWVIESQDAQDAHCCGARRAPSPIRDLLTHTSGMSLNPPPGIGELHGTLHKTLAEAVAISSHSSRSNSSPARSGSTATSASRRPAGSSRCSPACPTRSSSRRAFSSRSA